MCCYQVTSLAVVNAFIARIKEVNPQLNAVVADRFQAAEEEAAELDRLLDSGSLPKELSEQNAPYLGVPVTTKEALQVAGNELACFYTDHYHSLTGLFPERS